MCIRDLQHNQAKTLSQAGKPFTENTFLAKVIGFVCQTTVMHFVRRNG